METAGVKTGRDDDDVLVELMRVQVGAGLTRDVRFTEQPDRRARTAARRGDDGAFLNRLSD